MESKTLPLTGGCLCGAIRYTLLGPAKKVFHCHCSMCRKLSGAFYATGALVEKENLRIDKGSDTIKSYMSSQGAHRLFCNTCGGQLFMKFDETPDEIFFSASTLDGGKHPGHAKDMECHVHVGSKVEWEALHSDLPQFEARPSD